MKNCIPCKTLKDCIQFADFTPSDPNDKLYLSTAQAVVVTCPDGTQTTVNMDAGIVGYVLTFQLGNPPYPDLTLNCTGGTITVSVPDNANQQQLDDLINGMLNTCLQQIAKNIGCGTGQFFNTQQTYNPCSDPDAHTYIQGAVPAGVGLANPPNESGLSMAAGIIQSTISIADANAKAQLVLEEIFSTGNAICNNT